MLEQNPHRKTTRLFVFIIYTIAGFVLLAGIFFTLAAATTDLSVLPFEGMTNRSMAVIMASTFLVIALLLVLSGRLFQRLFGHKYRQEKLRAKTTVGCLRLSSLGCGLWALISTLITILTGQIIAIGEPAGLREIFIGSSGFILLILLMLSVAWLVSSNYARLKPEDYDQIYEKYRTAIQSCLPNLAEPKTQAYMHELTREVLTRLDALRKGKLLTFLSQSGLLSGEKRIRLQGADFCHTDLNNQDLPYADLREINLEQANLQRANLFEVNFSSANLQQADLSLANLQGANLQHADLTGAVLERTNLLDANLTGAQVTQAQLSKARL